MHVYALIEGLEEEQEMNNTRTSTGPGWQTSLQRIESQESLQRGYSQDFSDHQSIASEMSMDEDQQAEVNAQLLRTLQLEQFDSQHMAPFAPVVHCTHITDIEGDLMRDYRRKDNEYHDRQESYSRPVSASSGSESSRPSTTGSLSSEKACNLAMLRGEFHVCLTVEEARDLRPRPQHVAPSACIDISWLPAGMYNKAPAKVTERTSILRGSCAPHWNAVYDFDVDPDGPEGWSLLKFIVWCFYPTPYSFQ